MLDHVKSANGEIPADDVDLFSDAVLSDPYETYARLRHLGPVVHLSKHDVYALPRHAEVSQALQDHVTFISGQGVGLSDTGNKSRRGTPIASDPPLHTLVRGIVAERLSLRAVREITPWLQEQAEILVDENLARGTFDGVTDFSRRFPLKIMADLIGLPQDGRDRVLDWADAGFNMFGPDNQRSREAITRFPELIAYIRSLEQPGRLTPGSMGAAIYEAAETGKLKFEQCGTLMISYLMAGLDTTINAISSSLLLFGLYPDQWDMVRANPRLLPTAYNEVLRLHTPIQNLRRVTSCETEIGGKTIPAGASVLMMYSSANRDEERWPQATQFDATRNPVGHLAFGTGIHNCPGQILARAESVALIEALARKVKRIEVSEPVWHLNNIVRGLEHLQVTVQPA